MHAFRYLFLFHLFFIGFVRLALAQAPEIDWNKSLGGEHVENVISIMEMGDGGYLIAGESASNTSAFKNGENLGGYDFWLVRLDKSGAKLWDKTYGGNGHDRLKVAIQTKDGVLLAGTSPSNADARGGKSENSRGSKDYWVIKINYDGSKAWDKTIGGEDVDELTAAIQTSDGGYLIGGHSISEDSGEKSEPSIGYDFWVVKLNSNGSKAWDKTFQRQYDDIHKTNLRETANQEFLITGTATSYWVVQEGNGSGTVLQHDDYWAAMLSKDGTERWSNTYGGKESDLLESVKPTEGGGFLLAGSSNSYAGDEKSESPRGKNDYWIVRIDKDGNKVWDKSYGGSENDLLKDVVLLEDGYLLAGSSSSNADQDGGKSENALGKGDYWVVKIDLEGGKAWDKTIGGSGEDSLRAVTHLTDGFLITGSSASNALENNKSENSRGEIDYWIVKLDNAGNRIWDKTLGGNSIDFLRPVMQNTDGSLLMAGHSSSNASGDKSEANRGIHDIWVVKLKSEMPREADLIAVSLEQDAREGEQEGSFKLTLSRAQEQPVMVEFSLSGTAKEGEDYISPGGSVEIPAGQTSLNIPIKVIADDLIEYDETVIIQLLQTNSEYLQVAPGPDDEAELTIINEDTGLVGAYVLQHAAEYSDEPGKFELTLDKVSDSDIAVTYTIAGTATSGVDYEELSGEAIILAGGLSAIIEVQAFEDNKAEGDETVVIELQHTSHPYVEVVNISENQEMYISDANPLYLLSVYAGQDPYEDDRDGSFTFDLGTTFDFDITVEFTLSGTAKGGEDYEVIGGAVTIPAYESAYVLPVVVVPDQLVEVEESVVLTITNIISDEPVEINPAASQATISIYDNDVALLSVQAGNNAEEDHTNGSFILNINSVLPGDITIFFSLSGTATEGEDYTSSGHQVILPAGQTTLTIPIEIIPDELQEGDETVVLEITSVEGEGVTIDEDEKTATIKIIDNYHEEEDILISVVAAKDAAEGKQEGSFKLHLTKALDHATNISFTLSGTATAGEDYVEPVSPLSIPAGQASISIPIKAHADNKEEGEETLVLMLESIDSEAVSIDPQQQTATIKIIDEDQAEAPAVLLSVKAGKDAREDNENGNFILQLAEALDHAISISFKLSGTATEGVDYLSPDQEVVLAAGQVSLTIPIEVIPDELVEGDETGILTLTSVEGERVSIDENNKTASIRIVDNDHDEPGAAFLSIQAGNDAKEDDQAGSFVLGLTAELPHAISVRFSLAGTAKAGKDYVVPASPISIPAGQTSLTIPVEVLPDNLAEGDETIILTITSVEGEGVSVDEEKKTASILVIDNDHEAPPQVLLSVQAGDDAAAEDKQDGSFTLHLAEALDNDISVHFTLSGTATPGDDYIEPVSPLSIQAGQVSITIPVKVIPDDQEEGEETVVLTLIAVDSEAVTIEPQQHTATIKIIDMNPVEHPAVLLSVMAGSNATEDNENGGFTLQLTDALDHAVSISFSLSGTATEGVDYVSPGNEVVLPAGNTSVEVPVEVIPDVLVEGEEKVILTLTATDSEQVAIDPGAKEAYILIIDNDEAAGTTFVPNLFSPNGDQRNDNFLLHASHVQSLHWRIFNQQGRLVYETKDVEEALHTGWDGNVRGRPQPEGSYVWILQGNYHDGSPLNMEGKTSGSVTLIR